MINELYVMLIAGAFLIIMSIMDIKHKQILSIIPTTAILFLIVINIIKNSDLLVLGIAGFTFAWLLYEFDFFRGMADVKAMIIISLLLNTLQQFLVLMFLTVSIGLLYQLAYIKYMNKDIKKFSDYFNIKEEVPFVPALTIVYFILMVLSYYR